MTFLNELKRGLATTGVQVAKKTKELTDTVQLKAKIAAAKEAENRIYTEIGKKVYELGCEKETFAEEFAALKDNIKKRQAFEEELWRLEKSRTCPACGARLKADDLFCCRCGARVSEGTETKAEEPKAEEPKADEPETSEPEMQEVKSQVSAAEEGVTKAPEHEEEKTQQAKPQDPVTEEAVIEESVTDEPVSAEVERR